MNICGVVVHAQPGRLSSVMAAIEALDGAEVHAVSPEGKLVVTVEDTASEDAGQAILALHKTPGVLSASLVYHHFEPDPELLVSV